METTHDEEVKSASHEVHGPTMDEWDPWNPPRPPCRPAPPDLDLKSHAKLISEWYDEVNEVIATSRRTNIITPDRTPESVDDALWDLLPRLVPILEQDSVRRFLDLFDHQDCGLAWGFIITPLTFTQMVKQNALRCAKVALEGKAPELSGLRANPNCMNRYGYFPLHEAAEMFSVDMIKLLLRYGASANVRTAGAEVIEGLLPLHVAVENTCLHKYLEDNAFLNQEDVDNNQANVNYVCKLIHLLCLPEMKIFLDTTRVLGERTNNLIDELWNYIKDGKLVQSAILLLATQKHIRGGSSCNKNGKSKPDGFSVIINRILDHTVSLERGQNGKENKQLEVEKKLTRAALLLVHAISQAGETLDAYIRSHPEVPYNMQMPHNEVLDHVSSILKDKGFCPTGEDIDIGNLCRYERVLSEEELPNKHGGIFAIEAVTGMPCQHSKAEKVVRNATPRAWKLKYARRSFFPYWRSVLKSKLPVKVIPGWDMPSLEELENSRNKSAGQGSSPIPDLNLGLVERFKQLSNQHKRTFCSAAFPLLKVLRNA
ncbi:uncharacterized protein LOC133923839 [Phragmites australis]|uniref:uncharacterized protein LOC133923839 n=1 Tax=Phragmites australis TaxID=29695 RepID=UPI002D77ECEA|nr:uncharacterized protein LOC133923839 [Phragmites australis]XP_062225097.1 uncharacterized protein LOC133923839 [Phragmites australis]XP_062225098.1 uncharacterized protein LOC133923839 [Phragmites australis]XP_062225099.1 uncharacterized protein LOC133923839 [Phragmites australis]